MDIHDIETLRQDAESLQQESAIAMRGFAMCAAIAAAAAYPAWWVTAAATGTLAAVFLFVGVVTGQQAKRLNARVAETSRVRAIVNTSKTPDELVRRLVDQRG